MYSEHIVFSELAISSAAQTTYIICSDTPIKCSILCKVDVLMCAQVIWVSMHRTYTKWRILINHEWWFLKIFLITHEHLIMWWTDATYLPIFFFVVWIFNAFFWLSSYEYLTLSAYIPYTIDGEAIIIVII